MAHVQHAARVRQHRAGVELGPARVFADAIDVALRATPPGRLSRSRAARNRGSCEDRATRRHRSIIESDPSRARLTGALDGGSRRARGPARDDGERLATEASRRRTPMSDRSLAASRRRLIVATAAAALPAVLGRPPMRGRAPAPAGGAALAGAAAGHGLHRPGRAGALSGEREVRRRPRPLGRPGAAPSQRPRGRGAARLPRRAAGRAARRRALARPRPLRCALGDRSHAPSPRRGRLGADPLHGVRAARRRRHLRRAGDAPGRAGEGVAQRPAGRGAAGADRRPRRAACAGSNRSSPPAAKA